MASPGWFCVGSLLVLSLTGQAVAQSEAERAEKWFRSLASEAAAGFPTAQFTIKFRIESDAKADTSEIAALRSKVEGLPQHPERVRLHRLEHLQQFGPTLENFAVWFRRGDIRVNRDSTSRDPVNNGYNDACVHGDVGWILTRSTLSIVPTGAKSIPGHSAQMVVTSGLAECKGFFGASLSGFGQCTPDTQFRMTDPQHWEARNSRVVGNDERVFIARGSWDSLAATGRSESAELVSAAAPQTKLMTFQCSDWMQFDRYQISRKLVTTELGIGKLTYTLVSVDSLSDDEFEVVAAVPSISKDDPTRGPLTFVSIDDRTGGEPRFTARDPVSGELRSIDYSQTKEGQARSWLRHAGWAVAAVIGVILIVLQVRKRSH